MTAQNIKVGFQGTPFSYSEKAAQRLVEEYSLKNVVFIPLESSRNVAEKLRNNEIDYGVVALQNTVGGDVKETEEAFLTNEWLTKCKVVIDINHCLFVKKPSLNIKSIKKIVSHEQALKQCKTNLHEIFDHDIEFFEETDTAKCADLLANGHLDNSCAVICSYEAGEFHNLHLVESRIQDHKNNRTEFALLSINDDKSSSGYLQKNNTINWLFSNYAFPVIQRAGVTLLILSALTLPWISNHFFPKDFSISLPQAMITMTAVALGFFVGINNLRKRYALNLICGYWVYMDKIVKGQKDPNQTYAIPRVVRIRRNGLKLQLRGWICEKPSRPYFQSNEVFHDDFMEQSGTLIYKYKNNLHQGVANFDGMVLLEWSKFDKKKSINNLYGRYFGFMTDTQGELNFKRISAEKFQEHRGMSLDDD